jgi:hypothetical protein
VTHSDFFTWPDAREAAVPVEVSNALREAGYEAIHRGGGCLAWMRRISDQEHILITSNNDISGDPDTRSWEIGRYDENGWVNLEESFTLEQAIRCADLLPAPVNANGDSVEKIYPSLDAVRAIAEGNAPRPHPTSTRSSERYWMASETWAVVISPPPSRSAMVRAIFSTRW